MTQARAILGPQSGRSGRYLDLRRRERPKGAIAAAHTQVGVRASEPEFAYACLVEAEVVTDLVTHSLDYMCPEAVGIIAKVAYQRVAKDQDLVWQATAPEEWGATQPGADVHAVRVVLYAAVGNDDRHMLQRSLELNRKFVKR
jgi:hypothetical protein